MQVLVALIFLVVWLLILWIGSLALEAAGLERRKARFQALSALTGTGFTTTEAESVVDHPRRRRIITWLIVLGNAGIVTFLLLVILYIIGGLLLPSPLFIGVAVVIAILIILGIRMGAVDRIDDAILGVARKGRAEHRLVTEGILHQVGGYGVVRLAVGEDAARAGLALKDSGLMKEGITILAIERKDAVLPFPAAEEPLQAGDQLLCYGVCKEIGDVQMAG